MLLISIRHGAWEQRKGCLSLVSKKENVIIAELWQHYLDNVLSVSCSWFQLVAGLWEVLCHPDLWRAHFDVLWLCLEELRPGSVVFLSEWGFYSVGVKSWHMHDSPGRAPVGCSRIKAPGRKTCWEASSYLGAHRYSGSYWEGGEELSWFKTIEGMDTPKLVASSFSFNPSLFANKERWMGVDLSEKITRQSVLTKPHTFLIEVKRAKLHFNCSAVKCQLSFSDLPLSSTNPLQLWKQVLGADAGVAVGSWV